jgi:hypothetical protein
VPDKLIVRATEHSTYPNPRRTKLVGRHVGLTQAYELRDTASEQANQVRDCQCTSLEEMAVRAQALRNLASVWEVASERIRIIKGKPMPGSLRPVAKPKKVRTVSTKPLEQLPAEHAQDKSMLKQSIVESEGSPPSVPGSPLE